MTANEWKILKSGSDIRGIASGGEDADITLTNDVIERISMGFAQWLSNFKGLECKAMTVAVGNDSRESALRIKSAVISALRSVGLNIYDCSLSSTPGMFMTTSSLSCSGAIQITASHHPANRNGLKFFTVDGGLSEADILKILDNARKKDFPPISHKRGNVRVVNAMEYYSRKLRRMICKEINSKEDYKKPLIGLKICVDAGNGAGGFFATDVLKPLGADISGSIYLEPDGKFPNHIPNPENSKAVEAASKAVLESKSDLGIIFDTDVDRVGIIDSKGEIINKNKLIALSSTIVLENNKGATIVTDSVTSDELKDFITAHGGIQYRFKRGYKNIITAAQSLNSSNINCLLAIETSGHAAFKENDFLDDGAYLAAKIIAKEYNLRKSGQSIGDLLSGLKCAKESSEIRIPITDIKVATTGRKVMRALKNYVKEIKGCEVDKNSVEGVRLKFKTRWQEGWCILRPSVHDPVLVLNIESYVNNGILSILKSLNSFFEQFPSIDTSNIEAYISQAEK